MIMNTFSSLGKKTLSFLFDHIVTVIFVVFIVIGLVFSSDLSFDFFINELLARFFRNGFLVLSLIIPVIAGLGLNFGIVVGAIAGMLSIIAVRFIDIGGFPGLSLCFLLALPLALLFGYATGKLYNRTRGQETIASIIVGYFANGVYQFIVLFAIGAIIPVAASHPMVKPNGIGLNSTFDMGAPASQIRNPALQKAGLSHALDRIWQAPFIPMLVVFAFCILAYLVISRMLSKRNPALRPTGKWVFRLKCAICAVVIILGLHGLIIPRGIRFIVESEFLKNLGFYGITIPGSLLPGIREIPAITGVVLLALCLFTHYFTKTKLGQDCRSVGQTQYIARISGINVDSTRIIATMISTVLASWGMIIFLQNMGTVSTYSSHMHIGMFSVASLLVGGASTTRASVKNALVGVLLFNAMFIVSPEISRLITGGEGLDEYTRSFMVYGIIGLALGLNIRKDMKTKL